jgi:hypothetical protein
LKNPRITSRRNPFKGGEEDARLLQEFRESVTPPPFGTAVRNGLEVFPLIWIAWSEVSSPHAPGAGSELVG